MNPDVEIPRLLDLMPASGRMYCKIVSRPEQEQVIAANLPLPWQSTRPVYINFDFWEELTRPQRDLLLIRTVNWLTTARWLKFDLSRSLLAIGLLGTVVELAQFDAIGIVAAGGLTAFAGVQIWRSNRSSQIELAVDEAAIRTAMRRGYSEVEASRALLGAIEAVAKIEGRFGLDFVELLRCQNLRSLGGLSGIGVPDHLRQE